MTTLNAINETDLTYWSPPGDKHECAIHSQHLPYSTASLTNTTRTVIKGGVHPRKPIINPSCKNIMSKSIVYIAFVSADYIGVIKKVNNQASTWRSLGYNVTVVFDVMTKSTLIKYATRYLTLFRYFILNKQPGSAIYLRQTPELPLYAFMLRRREFSCEVNADVKAESENYSILKRFIASLLHQNLHNIARSTFYISSELSRRMHQSKGMAYTFPNSLHALPAEHLLPRKTNVVFVGTPEYPWQGFDLFLSIVQAMPAYQFHVIGTDSGPTSNNLKYHGKLVGHAYNNVMSQMDFAIGTLAFHRAGITEGSPLKVRDYLAFNLPFVIGYIDSDFSELDFCLCINTEMLSEEIYRIEKFFDFWNTRSINISDTPPFLNTSRETKRASLICG